jgi:tetratricopeptide (TPR) repeat protein
MRDEFGSGHASTRRALALAPGRADLQLWAATAMIHLDRVEEALPLLRSLPRLEPVLRYMHLFQLAICYRRMGRLDEAILKHRESIALNPEFMGTHMNLAAIYAELGHLNHARDALAELLRLRPDFSIERIPRLPSGREFLVENLRKAGLRE